MMWKSTSLASVSQLMTKRRDGWSATVMCFVAAMLWISPALAWVGGDPGGGDDPASSSRMRSTPRKRPLG
jgi:hypothetical protein